MAELPEEFAPTGPKLSRFPIKPAPPVLPRLFPDEQRFAARLALLSGAGELAVWAVLGRALVERREGARGPLVAAAAGAALLRALGPLWAKAATRVPRPLVAALLLAAPVAVCGAYLGLPARSLSLRLALLALGLPALGVLAASTVADTVTVERRPAAYSALEMGQALGLAVGVAAGAASPKLFFFVLPPLALVAAASALRDLRDRGTPRSAWDLPAYVSAAREATDALALAALCAALGAGALALSAGSTFLGGVALPAGSWLVWLLAPAAGMALATRLDALRPQRALALRAATALAAAAFCLSPHAPDGWGGLGGLLALGAAAAALPAAILRAAPEMERPAASSLGFIALALGAGLGALATL